MDALVLNTFWHKWLGVNIEEVLAQVANQIWGKLFEEALETRNDAAEVRSNFSNVSLQVVLLSKLKLWLIFDFKKVNVVLENRMLDKLMESFLNLAIFTLFLQRKIELWISKAFIEFDNQVLRTILLSFWVNLTNFYPFDQAKTLEKWLFILE